MRAVCESCAKPQPVDWRPGDLCVQCGCAARVETRCFWCAKWGPKAKFCRSCGAIAVAAEHYGAARMLKHHGASMYEIPKLLAEFEPDLIATHQSLYGAHAALANRHVEDARWLGGFLYQKHWAERLEDELIPQLPWPEEKFRELSAGAGSSGNVLALSELSPVPRVRELALLVRIQQGDFRILRDAAPLLHHPDAGIVAEAALQLTSWRALYTTYTEINRYQLLDVLRVSPLPQHAAPRMAVLGSEPPPDYSLTGDADTDFLVHILEKNINALEAMLVSPDPKRRYAAASNLIRMTQAQRIGSTLLQAGEEDQVQLLHDLVRYKRAYRELEPALFSIVEFTKNARALRAAARAIGMARDHAACIRLLRMANGHREIIQALLGGKPEPRTYLEIGRYLVETGHLSMDHWGWDDAAKPGAMPIEFVEEVYPHAADDVKEHLLRFAEKQIEAHGAERSSLERHLIRQCFAAAPVELMGTAWACIHRIQMHRRVGLTVPCDLSMENVQWCWSMPEVLQAIARLMGNPEAVRQTFVRDDFDRFLRSAPPEFFEAAAAHPEECAEIRRNAPQADPYTYAARFAAQLPG